MMNLANISKAVGCGAVGAGFLTAVHESARRVYRHAPRVDLIGMRAIAKPLKKAGYAVPEDQRLHRLALAGDLVSNSLYYSLALLGSPEKRWRRAFLLGSAAGIGAVVLPPFLGLGQQPSRKFKVTAALTGLWYLSGALVTVAAARRWNY